jgi:hypothetical protein
MRLGITQGAGGAGEMRFPPALAQYSFFSISKNSHQFPILPAPPTFSNK